MVASNSEEVLQKVVEIIVPYAQDNDAVSNISNESTLLGDLKINSARIVDIVLDLESEFDIAISDDQMMTLRSVGDLANLVGGEGASS